MPMQRAQSHLFKIKSVQSCIKKVISSKKPLLSTAYCFKMLLAYGAYSYINTVKSLSQTLGQ